MTAPPILPGANPLLRQQLENPPVSLDFAELPEHWRRTQLIFTCPRPKGLEEGPWLPVAVRGAWGRRLLAQAVRENGRRAAPDPFGRASALQVFFRQHAMVKRGLAVPKPYVIGVEAGARTLTIVLTLFGFAGFWRKQAGDAMASALAGGLPLRERGRMRVVFRLLDVAWGRSESVPVPDALGDPLLVRLRTPLCLRASGAIENNLDDFVMSLVNRLSGLARWQGVRIETDWSRWRELSKQLHIAVSEHGVYASTRFSSAQPGRPIPHVGILGAFTLRGPLAPLMPLLILGETAHAGARTAFGFGAYEVMAY